VNTEKFWEIIQLAHDKSSGDMDRKCELIKESISTLDDSEVSRFSEHFDDMMDALYSWPLWGAAYVMNGGCSDDAFSDFRSSLISRGEQEFLVALNSPDLLVDFDFLEDTWFYEGFSYAVMEATEAKLGESPKRIRPHPEEPSGQAWEDDSETLSSLFPKLWVKFSHVWAAEESLPKSSRKLWWKFW